MNGSCDQRGERIRATLVATLGATALAVGLVVPTTSAGATPTSSPVAVKATTGDERFVAAAVVDLVGRAANQREIELYTDRLDRGWSPYDLARSLTRGNEWATGVVDDLYEQILRRPSDPKGRAYWAKQLAADAWTRDVAASLFASEEFRLLSGGTTQGYVDAVYERVLGRTPDGGGISYWAARIDAGGARTEVALTVFSSIESNGVRVDGLYDSLLHRDPDSGGRAYWSKRLMTIDDLDLAGRLVGSAEYRNTAQSRTDIEPTEVGTGGEWVISTPGAEGMDANTMSAARDYAFAQGRNTQGVVVVRHGKIVTEWYAPGAGPDSWVASWSVGKSFTGAAVGIALEEGKIPSVDVPMWHYYPDWKGTPREAVTLRHVLWMSSGLDFVENYSPVAFDTSDIIQMVVFQLDQLAYAATRPLLNAPGSTFNYSSGDAMLLAGVVEKATGMSADEYLREKLLDPMAMEKVEWWRDGAGHTLGYCCFDSTSRGFARFGQLYLQKGRWGAEQLIPEAWVDASWSASPAYDGYGYQWWLDEADPVAGTPAVYSARGHDGQFIYVVPSLDLVVVRNGTYVKFPGEPVADPVLFGRYPSDGLVPGKGTTPPSDWSDWGLLGPIVESIAG